MKKLINSGIVICCLVLTVQLAFAASGLVQISDHIYSYLDVKDGSPANSYGAKLSDLKYSQHFYFCSRSR